MGLASARMIPGPHCDYTRPGVEPWWNDWPVEVHEDEPAVETGST
jgi:hypothetical protein